MDLISTREIASLIWLAVLLLFLLNKPDVVDSIKGLFKALFNLRIIIAYEALAVYTIFAIWILMHLLNWDIGALKASILWFFFVGSPLLAKAITADENYNPIQTWAKGTFTFVILVEFLISKYTFSLLAELVILPISAIITIMLVISEQNSQHKQINKILSFVMAIAGLLLCSFAIINAVKNASTDFSFATLEEFSLPVLLSLITIPFFYAFYLYSSYENVFSTISVWSKDLAFKKRMQREAIKAFGLNIKSLMRWKRLAFSDKPVNVEQLKITIDETKRVSSLEKNPPIVSETEGWSPYVAKKFFESSDINTFDYREYNGKWSAESSIIKVRDTFPSNFLIYIIEGSETVAKTLRLKLTLNDVSHRDDDVKELRRYEEMLISIASPQISLDEYRTSAKTYDDSRIVFEGYVVHLSKEIIKAPNLTIEEYEFQISIL